METIPEPLLIVPRLDPKPWGGVRLADQGIELGERWAIGEAVLTSSDVRIATGPYQGRTLGELISGNPAGLLGQRGLELARNQPQFPMLIKLIDATSNLSIQVHPDNAGAPAGHLGKTEAWYILASDPDSAVYAGLRQGVRPDDLRKSISLGRSIEPFLNRFQVARGDVIFLPAGTVHALGGGIVIYEIQQQSTITYRLEDWGRDRELHVDLGLGAIKPESRPVPWQPSIRTPQRSGLPAISCEQFALEVVQMGAGDQVVLAPDSGPQVFTCVSGTGELSASKNDLVLETGSTAVLFANAGPVRLSTLTGARILRGWLG